MRAAGAKISPLAPANIKFKALGVARLHLVALEFAARRPASSHTQHSSSTLTEHPRPTPHTAHERAPYALGGHRSRQQPPTRQDNVPPATTPTRHRAPRGCSSISSGAASAAVLRREHAPPVGTGRRRTVAARAPKHSGSLPLARQAPTLRTIEGRSRLLWPPRHVDAEAVPTAQHARLRAAHQPDGVRRRCALQLRGRNDPRRRATTAAARRPRLEPAAAAAAARPALAARDAAAGVSRELSGSLGAGGDLVAAWIGLCAA